jgi:hypothetical protein
VAILVGLVASFEAKSAAVNYLRGAGYQRCEAHDKARKGKRGYVMAKALAEAVGVQNSMISSPSFWRTGCRGRISVLFPAPTAAQ